MFAICKKDQREYNGAKADRKMMMKLTQGEDDGAREVKLGRRNRKKSIVVTT